MSKQKQSNEEKEMVQTEEPYGKTGFLAKKDNFKQHLGQVFRKYFDKTGKSMTKAANDADMSYTYIAQIRSGETAPNSYMLGKAAEQLNIPAGEIFPNLPSASQSYVDDYLDVIQRAYQNNISPEMLDNAIQFLKQNDMIKKAESVK